MYPTCVMPRSFISKRLLQLPRIAQTGIEGYTQRGCKIDTDEIVSSLKEKKKERERKS